MHIVIAINEAQNEVAVEIGAKLNALEAQAIRCQEFVEEMKPKQTIMNAVQHIFVTNL